MNLSGPFIQIPPPKPEALPSIPPQLSNRLNVDTASASQLVPFYSEVYQYWASQVSACKISGDESSPSYQWAVYYADLSSRAAHHYNSIVNQETEAIKRAAASHNLSPYNQPSPSIIVRQPATNIHSTSTSGPPESFKQFAHRCISQCTTETQKKAMKALIELRIRNSLKDGSMHTKNWNLEPLLPVYISKEEGKKSYASVVSSHTSLPNNSTHEETISTKASFTTNTSDSTMMPSKPLVTSVMKQKKRKLVDDATLNNLPVNESYYGPSSTSTEPSKESKPIFNNDDDFIPMTSSFTRTANKLTKSEKKKMKLDKKDNFGFEAGNSKLAERADRFSGKGGIIHATSEDLHSVYKEGMDRYMGKGLIGGVKTKLDETDYEKMTVKGTCSELEKDFFRLTAPPKAHLVRPQPILEKHLTNLKKMWKQRKKGKGQYHEYNWFCSQLKAIRQDLVVQRIFNDFAVKAYETHARIALEEGDLNEYNQSQTQLKELYEQLKHENVELENENEFIAYRIIYHVFLTGNKKYEGGSTDILNIMISLTSEQQDNDAISHALKVRAAVADNDYHTFFKLRKRCPNLGVYLMDAIMPQMRASAMRCMMLAYRPNLSVQFILSELGFLSDVTLEKKDGYAWLKGCGCQFTTDGQNVMTKESVLNESYLAGNRSSSLI